MFFFVLVGGHVLCFCLVLASIPPRIWFFFEGALRLLIAYVYVGLWSVGCMDKGLPLSNQDQVREGEYAENLRPQLVSSTENPTGYTQKQAQKQ